MSKEWFQIQLAANAVVTEDIVEQMMAHRKELSEKYPDNFPEDYLETEQQLLSSKVGLKQVYFKTTNTVLTNHSDLVADDDNVSITVQILSAWEDELDDLSNTYRLVEAAGNLPVLQKL
jgi:hypothetical protein